jgi:hypothetical protein
VAVSPIRQDHLGTVESGVCVTLVVVDAENVRRSLWPNLSRDELVGRARDWAAREGHELLIVFDGRPPRTHPISSARPTPTTRSSSSRSTSARVWWLVSSDRALREHVGDAPNRIVGGGSFVRTI